MKKTLMYVLIKKMRYTAYLQIFDMYVQFLANEHWCLISNGFRLKTKYIDRLCYYFLYIYIFFLSISCIDNKISDLLFKIIDAYIDIFFPLENKEH